MNGCGYTNQATVGAGEKDQNIIRALVQKIVRKALGLLNGRESSPYDPGGLTDQFCWFSGFQALSPYSHDHDAQPA